MTDISAINQEDLYNIRGYARNLVGQDNLDKHPLVDIVNDIARDPEHFNKNLVDQQEKIREIALQRINVSSGLNKKDGGVCDALHPLSLTEDEYKSIRVTAPANEAGFFDNTKKQLRTEAEKNERTIVNNDLNYFFNHKQQMDCKTPPAVTATPPVPAAPAPVKKAEAAPHPHHTTRPQPSVVIQQCIAQVGSRCDFSNGASEKLETDPMKLKPSATATTKPASSLQMTPIGQ
jgi:hypothetical protein